MNNVDHIDELRAKYPHVSDGFFDLMRKEQAVQDALDELRGNLAYLVGYHDSAGAVPINKLKDLLGGKDFLKD